MKKFLWVLTFLFSNLVLGQTFPVKNLQVNGTQNTVGVATFQTPVAVTSGGIGTGTASGTALDNITGFASTGFLTRTGAGAYSFQSLINGITLGNLSQQAANTVLANVTSSTANITAFSLPLCNAATAALQYTTGGPGFICNTAINAATLGGATFAAPGPIGSTTPGTGAFTTLSASTSATAPTLVVGANSTGVATSALVANSLPCPSILDHGGDGSGTNNNDTAFANTLVAGPSDKACIYFPPGIYKFAGQVTYTMPTNTATVMIRGAGPDLSKLVWTGGGGIGINFITDANTLHVRDLSFLTGSNGVGTALNIVQTAANTNFSTNTLLSDVQNVAFHGVDGYQVSNYWLTDIGVFGVSNINFISDNFVGASGIFGSGIVISGDANRIPVQFNINSCLFSGHSNGFYYGTYTQGVTIQQSNFTNVGSGIVAPGSETGLDQLTVIGNQFNATSVAIDLTTNLIDTMIHGNLFLIRTAGIGVRIASANGTSIVGNRFGNAGSATSNTGIAITGYLVLSSVITGNSFSQLTTGINLTGAQSVNVQSNTYAVVTTPVAGGGCTGCTVGGGSN